MRIRTLGKPGRVAVVALERNLTWAPAYAVNLMPDGKTLNLVAKATVINDLEKLTNLDCRSSPASRTCPTPRPSTP